MDCVGAATNVAATLSADKVGGLPEFFGTGTDKTFSIARTAHTHRTRSCDFFRCNSLWLSFHDHWIGNLFGDDHGHIGCFGFPWRSWWLDLGCRVTRHEWCYCSEAVELGNIWA